MIKSSGPITLSGAVADDIEFRSMQFSEAMSTPFHYTLEVISDRSDLKPNRFLGQSLTVELQIDGHPARPFNGLISEFCLLGSVGEATLYRITLRPWLWMLQLATNCRIFQDETVPDIVLAVFRAHGFSDIDLRISRDYPPRPYTVQYRESDYNFVSRLLEDEGIYFFFSHTKNQHLLVLCDSPSAHEMAPGFGMLPYYPPDPNRDVAVPHVDQWQVTHRVESGKVALRDYDFNAPTADMNATAADPADHGHSAYEVYDYPGAYTDVELGKAYARRRLEEMQASHARAVAQSNARGVLIGTLLTLEKHPIEAQNKQYLLLSMSGTLRSHRRESGGDEADDRDVYRCEFTCMDSALPYQPPRKTPRPVVHGPQTAIVVGKKDEDIWTDEYGRVKLEFHWDRDSPGDENSSCWVRVAQLWAGSNFGGIHIPRIGQEVIVEFLEGDPDRPIVTGRVYNFDNKPPYELPINQTQSGIKSRSTLDGLPDNFNEIRFEDKKGSEELFIHAEKTQTTKVKQSQSISVGGSRSVSVGDTQSTTVAKKETQTYNDAREMTVAKTNSETITLAHTGTYKQGRTITVSAQDDALTVSGANKTTTVSGQYHIQADAEYKVTHKENIVLLSGAKAMVTNGKSTLTLEGGKITLSAPESITIECGGSSITLTPNHLAISATKVGVDGSGAGKLDLDATGAQMSGPKAMVQGNTTAQVSAPIVKVN
jgi:type VI secretion system secreted protein VgrG